MTDACQQLIESVFQALTGDPELVALLGQASIFDRLPERQKLPYVVIGRTVVQGQISDKMVGKIIELEREEGWDSACAAA